MRHIFLPYKVSSGLILLVRTARSRLTIDSLGKLNEE